MDNRLKGSRFAIGVNRENAYGGRGGRVEASKVQRNQPQRRR
jgi:hypothetical protein